MRSTRTRTHAQAHGSTLDAATHQPIWDSDERRTVMREGGGWQQPYQRLSFPESLPQVSNPSRAALRTRPLSLLCPAPLPRPPLLAPLPLVPMPSAGTIHTSAPSATPLALPPPSATHPRPPPPPPSPPPPSPRHLLAVISPPPPPTLPLLSFSSPPAPTHPPAAAACR